MIRLENIALHYGSGAAALQDVTLNLPAGSFHFLTGPSGAGKTSLLRLLSLSLRPTAGRLSLFDRETTLLPRLELPALRRRIGVVFQDFRLLPHLSVFENVALPLRLAGAEDVSLREPVTEILRWVGLGDRLTARPPALSGGEQQRVAICRAIINKPRLLLADEPTGNIDDAAAQRLMGLFVELNRMGTSVLIATHNASLLRQAGFPRFELKGGRIFGPLPALGTA